MPKKQVKATPEIPASASSATPKPAGKSFAKSTPRVSTARHSAKKDADAAPVTSFSSTSTENLAIPADPLPAFALEPVSAQEATLQTGTEDSLTANDVYTTQPTPAEDAREAIAKLAYSYYEARGFHAGDPLEDWVRAEREHYGRR